MHDAAYIPLRARDGSIRAHAIVDPADYEWLTQWRWHMTKKGHVGRVEYQGGGRARPRVRGFRMARELLGLKAGDPRQADHINLNPLDNRRMNLRIVDNAQNGQNRRAERLYCGRPAASPYRGVYRRDAKWYAAAKLNGKMHYLGTFATEEEAAEAARAFRAEHMPFSTT